MWYVHAVLSKEMAFPFPGERTALRLSPDIPQESESRSSSLLACCFCFTPPTEDEAFTPCIYFCFFFSLPTIPSMGSTGGYLLQNSSSSSYFVFPPNSAKTFIRIFFPFFVPSLLNTNHSHHSLPLSRRTFPPFSPHRESILHPLASLQSSV